MPVKLDDSGKCVVEPNGEIIKCHDTHEEALAHMHAINANTEKTSLTFHKDKNGVWNWAGVVSNNWMDREADIITSDAHRKFEHAIDSGEYKEVFGKDAPDLWLWHLPVPIGYTETVAYDDRGFLVAGGKGYEGEFYDKVFSGLAKAEEEQPGSIGMSHGMPWDFLEISKDDHSDLGDIRNVISGYMSEEFTFLPKEWAANLLTGLGGIMVKSMLKIEDYKEKWFIDTFGDDVVNEFNSLLSELGKAANDADIPKKELDGMENSTDVQETTVTDETLVESDVVEETVEDQEATTAAEEVEKADSEEQEEEDDSEEEEESGEKQFVTTADLQGVVSEIVKGVAEPMQALKKELEELREDLTATQKEISQLKESEDVRVTEKTKDTPVASLSSIIARTIVGQEKAQVDYNKERELHTSGPEETESRKVGGETGIRSIDAIIRKQRSGRSQHIMAPYNGQ